jgi:hypothetical protein
MASSKACNSFKVGCGRFTSFLPSYSPLSHKMDSVKEKAYVADTPSDAVFEKGDNRTSSSSSDVELAGPTFDAARTAQLLRKMDWNIVPFLALLYL